MLTKTEKISKLKQWLNHTKLDKDIVKNNVGVEEDKISPQVLLASSAKLIKINKGTAEPDDRDNLKFSKFMGIEDFVEEHIMRDAARVQQKAAYKMQMKKNLNWLTPGFFTPQIRSVIIGNSLANNVDGINPLEHWDNSHKVTKMGPGGIPSIDAIPPECYDKETKVFTKLGWIYWHETNADTEFACNIAGELQFHKANKLIKSKYTGELLGVQTRTLDILVTPNHRMWCRKYRNPSSMSRCGTAEWQFINMEEVYGKPREFLISHKPYVGYIDFNPDMAEFIGWFISEGHIGKKGYKTRFVISQSMAANPEKTGQIAKLLVKLGLSFKYSGNNFYIKQCQGLRDYLALNCGVISKGKTIPEEALHWSVAARTRLLESLISGDGHKYDNGHMVYHSTSQALITQIIRLAISLGYAAKQCKTYPRHINNTNHNDGLSMSILLSKVQGVSHTDRPETLANYYKLNYDDYVYCAQVPGELLLVCRNNHVPVWSGNSRNVAPSSFGFFDPVHISESERIGVTNYINHNVVKGDDCKLYRVMKTKDGLKWMNHEDILNKQVHVPEF